MLWGGGGSLSCTGSAKEAVAMNNARSFVRSVASERLAPDIAVLKVGCHVIFTVFRTSVGTLL